ncbi:MAG: LodA/GoxA family CTQ-dependent oxidase [Pseudonocardiales bacterium]|nr:LodA/GoxA family CTQ-dependent oxidase [Hyphomicrobiales bacterium]MBV8825529.1 LodA/GoxA family CTQ-dependent oxidase [Hyphomicrobiales bacterium]MBV9429455.1 LodA/GoxA family CTQ-dependent oxidase [Bradyrhizobiaceae bacterium]MBV9728123.1 LodA/GoxA family CTQ-dependent oxidase [Pseudonocardiales bacterium]
MTVTTGAFDFAQIASCKIHPGIGVARVGNSPDAYFIGPELPGDPRAVTAPDGAFKDAGGRVKRQAARFRIYGYDKDGRNLGELPCLGPGDRKGGGKAKVEWTVHLANKKGAWRKCVSRHQAIDDAPLRNIASVPGRNPDTRDPDDRHELIIDAGARSISSHGHSENAKFDTGRFLGTTVALGELKADRHGRLIVLGGFGAAGSTKLDNPIGADPDQTDTWANNDHWYDDISDGPVTATVTLPTPDARTIEIRDPEDAAWVIVAPPKYAPGIFSIVTLFDVVREVAIDARWIEDEPDVSYVRDIQPILLRAADTAWVNNDVRRAHRVPFAALPSFSPEERARLFARIRNPRPDAAVAAQQATGQYMPPLSGDGGKATNGKPTTWLSLLPSQYRKLEKWNDGKFAEGEHATALKLDDLDAKAQVAALQRAALEPCAGGAFYPGVEASYTVADARLYAGAFRIDGKKTKAGDVTKYLAVPWQASLYLRKDGWWPAARPDDIVPEEVFDEADSQWRAGGKPVSAGLEGRVRWDRGLGVSTLFRRPWQNPARAVDDPRDGERRGPDDMVRYWSELGFVVPRRSASGEIVHVETERRPYAGMDIRELFHALLNLEEHRNCLPKVQEYVENVLAAARQVQRLPSAFNFMNNIRPFRYSEQAFEARMKDIYDDCFEFAFTKNGRRYDPEDESHNPYFRTREQMAERIRQLTPFNFLDGAWLRNVHRLGPMDEVNSILFSIFNEELGDGVLAQNHANIYRDLCHSIDFYPPPVASLAFARDPQFLDSAFESATFQLGIAEFTERYYPEIIGMTLWLEWTALELHRVAAMIERVGLDAHFYRMHIAIDNAEDGHGAGILRAVKLYLHQAMLQGGDPAVQQQWQRIWDGYVAFALTFAILIQQVSRVVKEPLTSQEQLENLIRRKKTFGQYNHSTCALCGVPINEWFNEPTGFLRALIKAGFIVPGKPASSPFLGLLGFRGPMYRVFTEAEIELWRRWTLEEAWSLADSEDDGSELAADVKRLKGKLARDPSLAHLLSGDRLSRLQRVTSPRRIALWVDLADRHAASAPAAAATAANGAADGIGARKASAIEARFNAWVAWGMVRALTHLAAQPLTNSQNGGFKFNRADAAEGQSALEWLADIRDAANPARTARAYLEALGAEFEQQKDPSAGAFMRRLAATPLAQGFELVAPGNDGHCGRDMMTAWLECGCPMPDVRLGELKPLRIDSTLDEEEHHPTGVAIGFGTMH